MTTTDVADETMTDDVPLLGDVFNLDTTNEDTELSADPIVSTSTNPSGGSILTVAEYEAASGGPAAAPSSGVVTGSTTAAPLTAGLAAAPEWRTPLTEDEQSRIFGPENMAGSAPMIRLSKLDARSGRYMFEKFTVDDDKRDQILKPLSNTGVLPKGVRKIDTYSIRMQLNTELIRYAVGDREVRLAMGVSNSAKIAGIEQLEATADIDTTNYLRFAWSAYTGAAFIKPGDALLVASAEDAERLRNGEAVELVDHDKPLTRPNGDLYYPRKVRTGDDVTEHLYDTVVIQKAYAARIPVLLYGPPGTGKTSLAEAVLPNLITISGTSDTEPTDFLGSYVQVHDEDGSDRFEWVDGPLIEAMENGVPLFIDEIALIDSRVLAVVYSVMDGRDEIKITQNPRRGIVKAKEGFYVLGACNPDVPGAVMSDALLSRFSLQIEVTTDYDMLPTLGVDKDILMVAKNLAKQQAESAIMKAPETRELLAFMKIRKTMGERVALANLVATALPTDRQRYIETLNAKFEGTDIAALRT